VVGNCAISALIDPHGRMVWCCLPRFDGDPVFNALLGGEGAEQGSFAIEIENLAEAHQHYEPNTAVLTTELWDHDGNGIAITGIGTLNFIRAEKSLKTYRVSIVRNEVRVALD
jgi:hypothetical protein